MRPRRATAAEIAARWCARKVRGEDRESVPAPPGVFRTGRFGAGMPSATRPQASTLTGYAGASSSGRLNPPDSSLYTR